MPVYSFLSFFMLRLLLILLDLVETLVGRAFREDVKAREVTFKEIMEDREKILFRPVGSAIVVDDQFVMFRIFGRRIIRRSIREIVERMSSPIGTFGVLIWMGQPSNQKFAAPSDVDLL